ncbi:hypothetical protein M407DRAFT_34572 [Tulasnella calospora MUT 4182]|uniref:Uncharacterized protein n=1 Tax=Tulasnella calospora MUT 4182 TaxID=1051891 RepID=A0A0C3K346_9AGAM|nr:hypothetical protein M407DRAFT_34572 [Tulasnella calospora MUT 4182]
MVMITTQLAAIVATGIAVSGVSAAALPARNHARAQQQRLRQRQRPIRPCRFQG